MKYEDEHAAYHAHEEDRMIQTAELKAQEAEKYQGIAKAAWEAARRSAMQAEAFKDMAHLFSDEWFQVHPDLQVAWVEAAKAAVRADKANNK